MYWKSTERDRCTVDTMTGTYEYETSAWFTFRTTESEEANEKDNDAEDNEKERRDLDGRQRQDREVEQMNGMLNFGAY